MTREEVIRELRSLGTRPKGLLGQHFLIDPEVIKKITERIKNVTVAADVVLEIGPGLGVLTEYLVRLGKIYIGVEKDRVLAERLRGKIQRPHRIVTGDILKAAYEVTKKIKGTYSVVTNLPYYISARVLKIFLADLRIKPDILLMLLQKEVAEKCSAHPGDMTKLSVLAQLYAKPNVLFTVHPASFYPAPAVDSAYIEFVRKEDPIKCFPQNEKQFWQTVRIGFSSKRKKLANNLSSGLRVDRESLINTLKSIGLGENCRAQELSVEQWVKLVDKIGKNY